jgi:hypothetical protein
MKVYKIILLILLYVNIEPVSTAETTNTNNKDKQIIISTTDDTNIVKSILTIVPLHSGFPTMLYT